MSANMAVVSVRTRIVPLMTLRTRPRRSTFVVGFHPTTG
jgi:hypothetical protein